MEYKEKGSFLRDESCNEHFNFPDMIFLFVLMLCFISTRHNTNASTSASKEKDNIILTVK